MRGRRASSAARPAAGIASRSALIGSMKNGKAGPSALPSLAPMPARAPIGLSETDINICSGLGASLSSSRRRLTASIAASASLPSARTVILSPSLIDSSISLTELRVLAASAPRRISTAVSNDLASFTNCATSRACRPSRTRTVMSRSMSSVMPTIHGGRQNPCFVSSLRRLIRVRIAMRSRE
ncbi:hypothetical protein AiwAL_05500 [Acidiphilium sp. AL]|nr:hypothetical protein [Acidiphilium sp. AL]MCU4159556.1 hypothetical protein [Acidiphilium sp. AL]